MKRLIVATAAVMSIGAGDVQAIENLQNQNIAPETPALIDNLSRCRNIAADAARLACFDAAMSALDTARQQGDVVVIDRAQARNARRQLFGFQAPSLSGLFGREDAAEEVDSIETTLARAGRTGDGKWVFHLADGSEWRQIDSASVQFQNRAGASVRVRRAALGSYQLVVGGSRAVRVRRQ